MAGSSPREEVFLVTTDYHEPGIVEILILSSFLLVLNVSNSIIDSLLSCGLLVQILVGITWGPPGARLLGESVETTITSLGYLGLILLVFEGGLSTNIDALRKNLVLSIAVALTGISLPIALSFILIQLLNATPLQSFAAGAALCSTSLGTICTVLKVSGFSQTRLASVLMSAAMLDDVIGLVMVQVISNLNSTFEAASVVRPVGVSIAFVVLVVFLCSMTKYVLHVLLKVGKIQQVMRLQHIDFVVQTVFLVGMITAATYAGTSNLFAAYLAGLYISWWTTNGSSDKTPENESGTKRKQADLKPTEETPIPVSNSITQNDAHGSAISDKSKRPLEMYEQYYMQVVERLLKPFFFASIGFVIPIKQLFEASVVWRGFVYALLMVIAKVLTGLWLVHFDFGLTSQVCRLKTWIQSLPSPKKVASQSQPFRGQSSTNPVQSVIEQGNFYRSQTSPAHQARPKLKSSPTHSGRVVLEQSNSLYPAVILGSAMVARGEIGFLIAATANANGIYAQEGSQKLYLVVMWAILLCTVFGPIATGLLVTRAKRLQKSERNIAANERRDPLGAWGVLAKH